MPPKEGLMVLRISKRKGFTKKIVYLRYKQRQVDYILFIKHSLKGIITILLFSVDDISLGTIIKQTN